MKSLPKINSIDSSSAILIERGKRNISYRINEEEEDYTVTHVKLPYFGRPTISMEIVDSSNSFIHGFQVVQTANGEYAYIRQSDSQLLPFRYDVASDFNEYGFAMVGKDGYVSWIDTSFRHLDSDGEMVEEEFSDYAKFDGWEQVSSFSQGIIPLSRVYEGRGSYGIVSYFGIDGKLKEFYRYNGQMDDDFLKKEFSRGTTFDANGQAMADGDMLFAKGYYWSYKDLIKICKEKGFIDSISQDAEKWLDPETGKVLKKSSNQTNQFK